MNENPDRNSWSGLPPARVPALPANVGGTIWQPPGGASGDDSPYGREDGANLVQTVQKYFWIIFRHRWVFGSAVAACLAIGFIFTFLATPMYVATATIQIDRDSAKVVNLNNQAQTQQTADYGDDDSFYSTQYEILKSRSLAEKIASTLSVEELLAFTQQNVLSRWAMLQRLIGKMIHPWKSEPTNDASGPTDQDIQDIDVPALQMNAAGRVQGGLSVQPVGTSRIVRLNFVSPSPAWAQQMANAVANTFVALTLERRYQASSYARNFIEDRLKELKVKLEDSETQLVAYAQAQRIVNVDEKKSLVSTDLEALNAELATTSRARLKAEQLLQQAEATDGLALPQILNDDSVRKMREQRAELRTDYQNKLSFFKPSYPDMLNIKAQIDEIDKQIQDAVKIVKQSLKADYEAAKSQEDSLTKQLEGMKEEVLDLDSRGIQYRILQREVDTNRQLYDGLLQQFKEVGVAGAVGTNNVSIVDPAQLPGGPFQPNLSKNLQLALFIGIALGTAAALGLEYMDDTFKIPEDIESALGLPVLGIIPLAADAAIFREELADPQSSVSEAYRSLRTALQFSTADGAPKTLLLTSARPGEGKSTTAVALATNFAQLGLKVLLIDADLRNPSLHKVMERSATVGLSNYLTGNAVPQGAFQATDHDTLTFMAAGPVPPNPAELLAGPKMTSLFNVASERFDVVIIDGPPVLGIADAPLLASIASGTLLVIEAGETRRAVTRTALKRLHFARAQMVGALLSKFDARAVGHTYGYGSTEYYGYGAYSAPKQLPQKSV